MLYTEFQRAGESKQIVPVLSDQIRIMVSAVVFLALLSEVSVEKTCKPKIVFIMADDIGWMQVGV